METPIKVIISGPRGRMGKEAVKMVSNNENFQLVGVVDRINEGKKLSEVDNEFNNIDCLVYTDIKHCIKDTQPDCLVELSVPQAAFEHIKTALAYNVRPVVGTTGLNQEELDELETIANDGNIGCIIAPNFAIGAVLMMKFSQMAAKYFQDIEIIEMHHDQKLDAPSGTAIKTAQLIEEVRAPKKQGHPDEIEKMPGARGADMSGMHIHSVRLPGLIAHQTVMLGGQGETLTIRHDSYNRTSFMTGVKLSIETVMKLDRFVYGLENILD
ncbi:4-hydroxy-tetrahydrodipicolinate reductase [Pallidibacillus pasinlerensis]|uniref:4-hydroxy-tetrahydrodipicolinate reductase n=1 Tax=Pallidibacillus pasinlerensis TaxID=2703818 RepID=A0ABX0A0N4_9BACI|nr:4-hydroxy-tetrahydrodipicolinate reductase [Pallidibacillus pasinlerensis]NCU16397.1 4-hydroxy-tetrahydrodipicolinate reductase [Pallidibacillus pasinlerensis]